MRRFLILFVLLVPLHAFAQSTAPSCFPLVNGYPVGVPRHIHGNVGEHVFWACSDRKGSAPTWSGFSCLHSECSVSKLAASILAVTRASAKVGAAKAEYEKHVGFECAAVVQEQTPRGAMCRERAEILNANAAAWLGR